MFRDRSPARMLVGAVMLFIVYTMCWNAGMVHDLADAFGFEAPGAPPNLDDLPQARELFPGAAVPDERTPLPHPSDLFGPDEPTDQQPSAADQALDTLATLRVAGRAPKTGYDRAQFGPTWADVDGNGCDTRNDILLRDLDDVALADDGCTVLTGTLTDPYTGKVLDFVRGQGTSSAVHVDHVVALSDAWQKGAQALPPAQRAEFANDPANLLAVDGPTNSAKGDGDAATWLPPNKAFRCEYVTTQVNVKATYGLWVTAAERDAITTVLQGCP